MKNHRMSVLKANAFEAVVFLVVALGSLAAALVAMTVTMPISDLAALLVGMAAGYWVSVGLFTLTDQAAQGIRVRLHRTAHCADCTSPALRD